jgi:hypothetical protein
MNIATVPKARSSHAPTTTPSRRSRKSGFIPKNSGEHGPSAFGKSVNEMWPRMTAGQNKAKCEQLWKMVYHERKAVAKNEQKKAEFRVKLRNFIEHEGVDLDLYNEYAVLQHRNGANKLWQLPIFNVGTNAAFQQVNDAGSPTTDIHDSMISHSRTATISPGKTSKGQAHICGLGEHELSSEEVENDLMDMDSEYEG